MSKQAMPPPPGDRPGPGVPPPASKWQRWVWPIAVVLPLLLAVWIPALSAGSQAEQLSYSRLLSTVDNRQVKTITIETDGRAYGELVDGRRFTTVIPPQAGPALLERLSAAQVEITAAGERPSSLTGMLTWVLLLAPMLLVFWFWRRASGTGQLQGVFGAGKAKAKVFDTERPKTTFAEVAGYQGAKAEIVEVVDFLRQPERYRRAGATAPRGVLMIGPPGTGKTLLARAVAGEADVPFFSVVGSSFVEMYVGVGAARVRDLFAEARKRAPAIVFVDELDAIGARRAGTHAMVSNDEREQTLNQLLAEMDGFDPG
uniref:ATP-dependent metallopeptidase FtsH/Yme1/Tma family protein n=1 Tax=Pseudonocardia acaciae TaxID=551276 RepID=UPI0005693CC4